MIPTSPPRIPMLNDMRRRGSWRIAKEISALAACAYSGASLHPASIRIACAMCAEAISFPALNQHWTVARAAEALKITRQAAARAMAELYAEGLVGCPCEARRDPDKDSRALR